MMDDYTPTTNEVRADYVRDHTRNFDSYLVGRSLTSEQEVYGDRFDRWLAAHDAEVLAAAGVAPQPEPEYEYRLVLELHPPMRASWDQAETLWYPTVEEARATGKAQNWIAHYRIDYPRARFTERVERRVVAGEAEPVPNQEGEPS